MSKLAFAILFFLFVHQIKVGFCCILFNYVMIQLVNYWFYFSKAIDYNLNSSCWSLGQANIKRFGLASSNFFEFYGQDGYYTLYENDYLSVSSKNTYFGSYHLLIVNLFSFLLLQIVTGIEAKENGPMSCALYMTNKQTGSLIHRDACSGYAGEHNALFFIEQDGDLFDCQDRLTANQLYLESAWYKIPELEEESKGFKCVQIAPSPYFYSFAVSLNACFFFYSIFSNVFFKYRRFEPCSTTQQRTWWSSWIFCLINTCQRFSFTRPTRSLHSTTAFVTWLICRPILNFTSDLIFF